MKIRVLNIFGFSIYREATIKEKIYDTIYSYLRPTKKIFDDISGYPFNDYGTDCPMIDLILSNYKKNHNHDISWQDFWQIIDELEMESKIVIDRRHQFKGNPFNFKGAFFVTINDERNYKQ